MIRVIAIGLLLLYYWYFCQFDWDLIPSQPTTRPPSLPAPPPMYSLKDIGSQFMFDDAWQADIPDGYKILDHRFYVRDACHQQPDGTQILATGLDLYKHLRLDDTTTSITTTFEPHASFPMQQGHVFYFTCYQHAIQRVDMCPPGHVFSDGTCEPIDVCTGKKPGILLPNVYDPTTYYECTSTGRATLRTCPDRHYFLHDSCHSTQNLVDYCRFNDAPRILNDVTVVRCNDQNLPVFDTCPPGTALFGTFKCHSTACVGKPDGTRIALPLHREGPFQYSPGYRECRNERVSKHPHLCPSSWDPYLSQGDDLTHLPQVFDGQSCAVPSFCTNVTSDDPDLIVPVHEFTKHVRNWKRSSDFDTVTGYSCEGTTRKRKALSAGQRIDPKTRKVVSACDGTTEKVVVSGKPNHFFDCKTQLLDTCPPKQFFDGDACRSRTAFAHTYNDVDVFAFNGLSHDGWLNPWTYERVSDQKTCTGDDVLLSIYNVCSHPDCTLYPFLAQVDFSIKDNKQSECVLVGDTIVKRPTTSTFHYATQRERLAQEVREDPCVVGDRVRSGHFVIDASLYMTCDPQQPFVFCPSPLTTGIEQVNDNRFTCSVRDRMTGRLPAIKRIKFLRNELDAVFPLDDSTTIPLVRVNHGGWVALTASGQTTTREGMYLESTDDVKLDYYTRVSYPPDIAFTKETGVSKSFPGQAYYMPTQKHTAKPMTLPKHDIVACLPDFS